MNTTEIHLVFALGNKYEPRTLIGAARTQKEAWAITEDHMRRQAPMANGCQTFSMSTYPAAAEPLLKVSNPFPYRSSVNNDA
jgi:hypothetical protein